MGAASARGAFFADLGLPKKPPPRAFTPYLYAQIAFAMLGGWLVFRYVPDGWSLVGIALIAVCGGFGAWLTVREQREPVVISPLTQSTL